MTFDEYSVQVGVTAIYKFAGNNIFYPTLGLSGEAGEVAEKVKKLMRDKGIVPNSAIAISPEDAASIAKELGDVLWYVAAVSREIGYTLNDVAQMNIEKLLSRQARGTLQGSGDNR
jgi:NTP pyrophosphatase (non-canonical NTP hydrolase)